MSIYHVPVEERIERTVTVEARDAHDAMVRAENRACWLDSVEHGSVGVEAQRPTKVEAIEDEMSAWKARVEA